jgi:hypothetical protein
MNVVILNSLIHLQHDNAMPKPITTVFRAALSFSLVTITVLAVIPLDYSPVVGINDKVCHVAAFYLLALLVLAFIRIIHRMYSIFYSLSSVLLVRSGCRRTRPFFIQDISAGVKIDPVDSR